MKSRMRVLSACMLGVGCLAATAAAWAAEGAAAARSQQLKLRSLDVIGAQDAVSGKMPTTAGDTSQAGLFGGGGGYVHPYVAVTARYNDNIYRTRDNRKADWIGVLSPGIWVAVPARRETVVAINSSTTAPGGLALFFERPEAFSRYQAYAMYGADLEYFQDYGERDNTKQAGEVFGQFNLRGGLSLNAFDKYIDSEDLPGTGDSKAIDKFKSNLLGLVADWDLTEKFGLRADYNNFVLDYDEDANRLKDRTDNAMSLYGLYHYSPKTSLFIEYRYTDISYDADSLLDSEEHGEYVGIMFKPTVKTNVFAKVGGVQKDFANSSLDATSTFATEVQAGHAFTDKTKMGVTLKYSPNETTVSTASHQEVTALGLNYTQAFTEKIGASLSLGYTVNDYTPLAGEIDRKDKQYTFAPTVQYAIQQWLVAALGYSYTKRDSDTAENEFEENLFYLRLASGL